MVASAAGRQLGRGSGEDKTDRGGDGDGVQRRQRQGHGAAGVRDVERQQRVTVRPVPAVRRGGAGAGAGPAEPQVRHVQRLGGTPAAQARDQRVLARRRGADGAVAVSGRVHGRHVLPTTATRVLLPTVAAAAAAAAGRAHVQTDHLLRDAAGRGATAAGCSRVRVATSAGRWRQWRLRATVASAAAGRRLSAGGRRPVRSRARPVLRRLPAARQVCDAQYGPFYVFLTSSFFLFL